MITWCGARLGDLFEQTLDRAGAIAQAMRLAAPEAVGRERHQVRVAQLRRREPGAYHIDDMVARHACEVEHLRPAIASRPRRQEALAIRLGEEDATTSRRASRSVINDDEFAEAGLTEVLAQHLRVPPAQCGRRRPATGGTTNQLPDGFGESIASATCASNGAATIATTSARSARRDPIARPARTPPMARTNRIDCERNHGETAEPRWEGSDLQTPLAATRSNPTPARGRPRAAASRTGTRRDTRAGRRAGRKAGEKDVARMRPSQAATRSGSRHVYNCRARAARQIP